SSPATIRCTGFSLLKSSRCPLPFRIPSMPHATARTVCRKPYWRGGSSLLLGSVISARRHNAPDGPGYDCDHESQKSQGGVAVLASLLGCHDIHFTTGGVSKVWKGAGEGTDHSRPVAPSHAWAGAGSPILRAALMTSHRKISWDKPNQNAPMVATMLKSVNCAA